MSRSGDPGPPRPSHRSGRGAGWFLVTGSFLLALLLVSSQAWASEIVIYGFEHGTEGWQVPDWAVSAGDYVCRSIEPSSEHVEQGSGALKLWVDFPGDRWAGAYVERQVEVSDWSDFGRLSVSVLVPSYAPQGLRGRIILTIGDDWVWTEMNRAIPLAPGAWATVTVNLTPQSMDWKYFVDDTFRARVDRVGVRIESGEGVRYSGPVFLDHVRLAE